MLNNYEPGNLVLVSFSGPYGNSKDMVLIQQSPALNRKMRLHYDIDIRKPINAHIY